MKNVSLASMLLSLAFALGLHWLSAVPAMAQRGTLIQDLFRTIAEAELEKAQRKRIEAEKGRLGGPVPAGGPVPGIGQPDDDRLPKRPGVNLGTNQAIGPTVAGRTARMTEFISVMGQFNRELKVLVADIQQASVRSTALRGILPRAFRLSADTNAFCARCERYRDYSAIAPQHLRIDAGWRQLSFDLQSINGFPSSALKRVGACDRYLADVAKLVGSQPQINRDALHEKMIVVATYIQSMLDDLQLCGITRDQIRSFSHDGRLLRQGLLRQTDLVDQASYEDINTAYNDFIRRWQPYSGQLHGINNPFISRRLDRINECCEEVYALLWTRPPVNTIDLSASAVRLRNECNHLLDELTLRALSPLEYDERNRVEDGSRELHKRARRFHDLATSQSNRQQLRPVFAQFDSQWQSLRRSYRQLPLVDSVVLSRIDQECDHLRRSLGVTTASPQTLFYPALIQAAAALEGGSEYLEADIDRFRRQIDPPSLRSSIVDAADDLHDSSKRLHSRLIDRDDLRDLQRETDKLIDAWQRLSSNLQRLRSSDFPSSRARSLQSSAAALAPHVATIAASLSPQ